MAKRFSVPGISREEIDLSTIVSPASTSTGAVVIRSRKGPINRPVLVSNNQSYIDVFGEPVFTSGTSTADSLTPEMGYGSYAALQFLKESNALYVVRDFDTGDKYSSALYDANGSTSATSASGISCDSGSVADKLTSIYTLDNACPSGKSLLVGAIGPGTDGNDIAITLETFYATCDWANNYDLYTSATPTTANRPIAADVFKLQVFTKESNQLWADITYSSISASPVETFYGSRTSMQDSNNNQLKISDVVNGISQYIYAVPGTVNFTAAGSLAAKPSAVTPLLGGAIAYGTNLNSTDGWSYFNNREDTQPNILICPDYNTTVKQYVANIAATRKDCIAVVQCGARTALTTDQLKTAEVYGYTNPSYVAVYAGWDKMYDEYNDKTVYLPKAIAGASIMARTDAVANTWDAPAGIDRGIISSLDQLKRFSSDEIGILYDVNINTSKFIRGIGEVVWCQKTAQLKKSALDRINVRRLLLYVENSIEQALYSFLFSLNNVSTRLRVTNICDSFMSTVKAGGALEDYQVVCDETNNTSDIRNNHQLVVSLSIKPAMTIEFIVLRTIITSTGVSFAEITG